MGGQPLDGFGSSRLATGILVKRPPAASRTGQQAGAKPPTSSYSETCDRQPQPARTTPQVVRPPASPVAWVAASGPVVPVASAWCVYRSGICATLSAIA